jgi:hypothetical protein
MGGRARRLLVVGIAVLATSTAFSACTGVPSSGPKPPASGTAPSSSATTGRSGSWRVDITESLPSLPAGVTALAAGDGRIWVLGPGNPATRWRGRLLTIDASTGSVVHTSVAGGHPVAAAWTGGTLWIANGSLGSSPVVSAANTVWQIPSGNRHHPHQTYHLEGPVGLTPYGSDAWVLAGGASGAGLVRLSLLTDGRVARSISVEGTLAGVPGVGNTMVACGSRLALVVASTSGAKTSVQERTLATGALLGTFPLPVSGETALACSGCGQLSAGVSSVDGGGLFLLGHAGTWSRIPQSPPTFSALASTPTTIWAIAQSSPASRASTAVGYRGSRRVARVALPPGTPGPATSVGHDLWAVIGDHFLVEVGPR